MKHSKVSVRNTYIHTYIHIQKVCMNEQKSFYIRKTLKIAYPKYICCCTSVEVCKRKYAKMHM